jgi:hypothetical protein
MPTFDGGHCFLTVLLPISTRDVEDASGQRSSPVHLVREALSLLPTAKQSQVTACSEKISPFALNQRTHFARFGIIDDVTYNGSLPKDAIIGGLIDSQAPEKIDQLPCPYLMFTADFDAPGGEIAELRSWLAEIYEASAASLEPIFKHCCFYSAEVTGTESFVDFIIARQLETTMPFNDYWSDGLPIKKVPIVLFGVSLLAGGLAAGALSYFLLQSSGLISNQFLLCGLSTLVGLSLAAILAYRAVAARAAKPFPKAPGSDLRTILKALYLQPRFVEFAIEAQGLDDQALFTKFGGFLAINRLDDLDGPTQAPGVIK